VGCSNQGEKAFFLFFRDMGALLDRTKINLDGIGLRISMLIGLKGVRSSLDRNARIPLT